MDTNTKIHAVNGDKPAHAQLYAIFDCHDDTNPDSTAKNTMEQSLLDYIRREIGMKDVISSPSKNHLVITMAYSSEQNALKTARLCRNAFQRLESASKHYETGKCSISIAVVLQELQYSDIDSLTEKARKIALDLQQTPNNDIKLLDLREQEKRADHAK
jgi:hypothetical protein